MSADNGGGGMPARRAVMRWAARLFRRDWRQHLLILSLLTVTVTAAIGFMCAAYNIAPVSGRAEFGDATHFFRFDDPDATTLPVTLDAARDWFGTIDPIGHRSVALPGSLETIDYRSQAPDGAFGGPLLDLRSGRYPQSDAEVAITNGLARTLGIEIGSTLDLDRVSREVVGIVENPSALGDEFALLPPSAMADSDWVTMLVHADNTRVDSFRPPGATHRIVSARNAVSEDVLAAIVTLIASTLVMILVALIAAASFTVIAQRRLSQMGMMSAVGATEKHLRLVMLTTGAVTGAVAATLGAGIGVFGWMLAAPHMEQAVGARIDPLNIPWLLVAAGMLLAVATATGAAWWPGRTMSRIPPVLALSGRPPRPAALERSAVLAVTFVVGGAICLVIGSDASNGADAVHLALIAVGMLGVIIGVLLVGPIAIRALARCASRVPIAPRLALRDLSRYQARSGAALAAISLALGIPVTIVASAAAAENNVGLGNLDATQLLLHPADVDGPFIPDSDTTNQIQAGVDELHGILDGARFVRLDAAQDPTIDQQPGLPGEEGLSIGARVENGWRDVGLVYVATPELLGVHGIAMGDVGSADGIVTNASGELRVFGGSRSAVGDSHNPPIVHGGGTDGYSSLPQALISPDQLAVRGLVAMPSGRWLVETDRPLTAQQLSAVREVAARYGFKIEGRESRQSLATLRVGAVGIGMLLALGILAMTVGLIRGESTGELRTLSATGATRSTRRGITATTAAGLAALGALLGIAAAYIALTAGQLSDLTPLPLADLGAIAVGTPLIAGAAGWLLSGREPAFIARRPIE